MTNPDTFLKRNNGLRQPTTKRGVLQRAYYKLLQCKITFGPGT